MAKVGRKDKVDYILKNLDKIEQWIVNKNTDEFIADNLLIGYSTWMKYKSSLPEIIEIIEKAPQKRANMIEDIRQAQIKRALGFEYEESKTILVTDEVTGKPKILRKEIYKKTALPDPTAAEKAQFFLGDEQSQSRANFKLKLEDLEMKKTLAQANSEWAIPESEDNE